ncbi:MAG TPA: WG repeat-containing protein, partial [Bacteroidia bacterium]|nr:WG repeat-containing protein [Bacteroidia bacterium]
MRIIFISFLLFSFFVKGSAQHPGQAIPFRDGNAWGFADSTGKIISPCIYDYIDARVDSSFFVVGLAGKYGVVNDSGRLIVSAEYDRIEFDHAFIRIVTGNKCGLAGRSGKIVLPVVYDVIEFSGERPGLAIVNRYGKWGLASVLTGKEIIPCMADDDSPLWRGDDIIVLSQGNKYGACNQNGKLLVPFRYMYVQLAFTDSPTILAYTKKALDVYDTTGHLLVKTGRDEYVGRNDSLLFFDGRKGLYVLDRKGRKRLPAKGQVMWTGYLSMQNYFQVHGRRPGTYGISAANGKPV